jgi:acetyl esterase/lipase
MPRRLLIVALLLALTSLAAAQNKKVRERKGNPYPPTFEGATSEVYKTVDGTELKLFIFNPQRENPKEPRPAIVFFFGGGWTNGSPVQFEQQSRYLASRGMVAIAADYRVKSRNNSQVIDSVRDAKSAMRYVRANAERLGIDPNRIAAGGGSAGGHLAACTGTIPGLDEEGEATAVSSVPNAMVLYNPVMSLVGLRDEETQEAEVKGRLGIDAKSLSPHGHEQAGQAPMIMFFGTEDRLIEGAKAFQTDAKKLGLRCEIVEYEGQKHSFFNFKGDTNDYFFKTLKAADEFLQSIGYVKGPDTVDAFFEKK